MDLTLSPASRQICVVIPLTPASVHAVRSVADSYVDELTLYIRICAALENSKAPECERDHKAGALSLFITTMSKLLDGRPGDGGDDGAEHADGQRGAGALASHLQPPPHVRTLRFAGSPGAPCSSLLLSSLLRRALVAGPSTGQPTFVCNRNAAVRAVAGGGGVGRARCLAVPRRATRRPLADVWHWAARCVRMRVCNVVYKNTIQYPSPKGH